MNLGVALKGRKHRRPTFLATFIAVLSSTTFGTDIYTYITDGYQFLYGSLALFAISSEALVSVTSHYLM